MLARTREGDALVGHLLAVVLHEPVVEHLLLVEGAVAAGELELEPGGRGVGHHRLERRRGGRRQLGGAGVGLERHVRASRGRPGRSRRPSARSRLTNHQRLPGASIDGSVVVGAAVVGAAVGTTVVVAAGAVSSPVGQRHPHATVGGESDARPRPPTSDGRCRSAERARRHLGGRRRRARGSAGWLQERIGDHSRSTLLARSAPVPACRTGSKHTKRSVCYDQGSALGYARRVRGKGGIHEPHGA